MASVAATARAWLAAKLRALRLPPAEAERLSRAVLRGESELRAPLFANPFAVEDLEALDDDLLRDILAGGGFGLPPETLARGLSGAPATLVERVAAALPADAARRRFQVALREPSAPDQADESRRALLDAFFWELTYWRTPELYEELTAGETLHPGIFRRLAADLRGNTVLDAGAGTGRATLACLDAGAERVYAVEPSPGLRRLLRGKLATRPDGVRVDVRAGRFDALPLADASVATAIACSAFTSASELGGEPGLAELLRVLRPGGLLAIIWPPPEDFAWLAAHGFQYAALPAHGEAVVRFRSQRSAQRCARRFYARRPQVLRHVEEGHRTVPYRLLGTLPPHDYCWLRAPADH